MYKIIHINKDTSNFYRTFLYNSDAAKACIEIMQKGRSGLAYNVGAPLSQEVSIESLVEMIKSILDTKFNITYNNTIVRDIKRPGDPQRRILDTRRLVSHTGFAPKIPLSEGLTEMCRVIVEEEMTKEGV